MTTPKPLPLRHAPYAARVAHDPDYAAKSNASIRRIKHVPLREAYDEVVAAGLEQAAAAALRRLLAKKNPPAPAKP